jgi:tetratricopeptide (TPR) repeat protein
MLSIAIYDPRRLTEEDFLAGFVARNETANYLLNQLRLLPALGEATNRLLVGQRGMGKTSLLRRVAIGVARDPLLSGRYVPLTFREEQYNVRGIDRFWRNCGESLAEWLEEHGDALGAAEIDKSLKLEMWRHPNTAHEAFLACSSKLGKRPVLLVDNFDLILDAIPSDQHWQLRRILQSRGGPVLYGASSQFLRQTGDRTEAFYEFFQIHELEPLTEGELLDCIRRLVNARGGAANPVREILEREPQRLRVLHTLTGGNPRVLVLIYQLLERAESTSVIADLEILLDQMTPFYKSRIDELKTELPRAIIDAIALNWDPISSRTLSRITNEPITTISSQLNRLRKLGVIEEVSTSGSRSAYQIVERFFNIWYLMRHGTRRTRHKMRWFAAFLQSFYTIDQLRKLRQEIFDSDKCILLRPYYDEAIAYVMEKGSGIDHSHYNSVKLQKDGPRTADEETQISEASLRDEIATRPSSAGWIRLGNLIETSPNRDVEAEAAYRTAIATEDNDSRAWGYLARLLKKKGDFKESEAAYRRSIELNDKSPTAWVGLAHLLESYLDRHDEAEVAYRRSIELKEGDGFAWRGLARTYIQLKRYEMAAQAYQRAIEIDPDTASGWVGLAELQARRLGSNENAEKTLRKGLKLNPESAQLSHFLGHVLERRGQYEKAEIAYRRAIDLDSTVPASWTCLGKFLYVRLGRSREAEDAFRKAIDIDPNSEFALDEFGDFLVRLERFEEAEMFYRRAINLSPPYAPACSGLASLLHDLGRYEEAEVTFRKLIEINPKDVNAWVSVGELYANHLGRLEEAEHAYRQALEIDPKSAYAWSSFGNLLSSQKKCEEAEAALRRATDLAPKYSRGWIRLAQLLSEYPERREEAEAAIRRAIDAEPSGYRQWMILAEVLCEHFNRYEEAVSALRRALEINPKSSEVWITLGNLLQDHLNRDEEAYAAYGRALEVTEGRNGYATGNLFWLKVKLGKLSEAEKLRSDLSVLAAMGQELADAALEVLRDNFGEMTKHLNKVFGNAELDPEYFDDLLRLLRLIESRGYAPRLIDWFRQTENHLKQAPIYAAFVAYVRGVSALLDFSPEVRRPAQRIFDWLSTKTAEIGSNEPKKSRHASGRGRGKMKKDVSV